MHSCVNLWNYSFVLLWNCRLQVEQVNSEDNDSDGNPLALALRSLRFLSASKTIRFIQVYSFSDEEKHHFARSCAYATQLE